MNTDLHSFESIIEAEKERAYQLEDSDQFAFDTLTAIQSQQSNLFKWLLFSLVLTLGVAAILLQFIFIQPVSISAIGQLIQEVLEDKPHYLAWANLSLIGLILMMKKWRVFG